MPVFEKTVHAASDDQACNGSKQPYWYRVLASDEKSFELCVTEIFPAHESPLFRPVFHLCVLHD
jgi:hypothetical protein